MRKLFRWLGLDDDSDPNQSATGQTTTQKRSERLEHPASSGQVTHFHELQAVIEYGFRNQLLAWSITFHGDIHAVSKANMMKLFQLALASSDDYTHYIVQTYSANATQKSGAPAVIAFQATYRESKAQTQTVFQKAQEVVQSLIKPRMNDHQKVKLLHDWVVIYFAYDTNRKYHSAYDGIRFGKAVCEGYSLMMYALLYTAGIDVRIVEGSGRGEHHAWNLVKIDNAWYHIDATWDDPVPDRAGQVSYEYYLLTDAEIRRTHQISRQYQYPSANSNYLHVIDKLKMSEAANMGFYSQLEKTLGFVYLKSERTFSNSNDICAYIQKMLQTSPSDKSISFRYLNGKHAKSDVTEALRQINRSATFTISPFERAPENNSVIVSIQFNR